METESFTEAIFEANIRVHNIEAKYYELLHPEVYNRQEQERISTILMVLDRLVTDNRRKALDCGAGTGNLTRKLLDIGYNVIAVDISPAMCQILRMKYKNFLEAKKLIVLEAPIEKTCFKEGEFDLITCYSVLHHLPDYLEVVRRLSFYLKKGGVMYLDHEISPFYWKREPHLLGRILKSIYFHSNPMLNTLYLRLRGIKSPSLDYTLADYWFKKEHPIDHGKIEEIFKVEKFEYFKRFDYHLKGTWLFNPIFNLYKYACWPEMSFWVAKK